MTNSNDTIKTYGTCLFWTMAVGCAFFLIGYWIGNAEAPAFRGDYNTESVKTTYALNAGLIAAAIGTLGALIVCGIIIKMKGSSNDGVEEVGPPPGDRTRTEGLPPRVPRQ